MKRIFDLSFSILVLPVALGVLAIVAALVFISLGRPVFFTQVRPGLGGRPFRLIKFRTMRNEFDPNGNPLPDVDRMTRFGRFLRSSSLDELPEFWNIIRGDMSLVGPRPLLVQYLERYNERQARRHEVRPGLTGWAQVNGRNAISWDQRLEMDVWYVENHSIWVDLKILLKTVVSILHRRGISADGEATMPEFTGTPISTE
jgi:lipopolysaccharide/colanic/teichoic acid biosynthesis glycosyltransferase